MRSRGIAVVLVLVLGVFGVLAGQRVLEFRRGDGNAIQAQSSGQSNSRAWCCSELAG